MKHLIVGFGSIGRRHYRNLKSLGEQDIVLLRSGHSTLPLDEIEGVPAESDLDSALAHQPDTVFITNPTGAHMPVALAAARAGCHLFIEKPVSHDLHGLDELKQLVGQHGGQVLVGYQFRFHPGLQRIKAMIEQIGTPPISARVEWGEYLPNWHPWEDYRQSYSARQALGGGVALTLSHPIDYLHWLLGDLAWVFGVSSHVSSLELDVDDLTEGILRFDGGTTASLHLDYFQRPTVHRMSLQWNERRIEWDNRDGIVHLYQANEDRWLSFEPPARFDRNDLFLAQTKHFLALSAGTQQPVCSLDDGIYALKVALALHRSTREGCSVTID